MTKLFADVPISITPLPGSGKNLATSSELHTILAIVFGIIGAIALLMIVIGGLQYILSTGDPQKTNNAKNTIIYALVGLAIAVSAEAIVGFVLGRI